MEQRLAFDGEEPVGVPAARLVALLAVAVALGDGLVALRVQAVALRVPLLSLVSPALALVPAVVEFRRVLVDSGGHLESLVLVRLHRQLAQARLVPAHKPVSFLMTKSPSYSIIPPFTVLV